MRKTIAPLGYVSFDTSCKLENCIKKQIAPTTQGKIRYKCVCGKISILGETNIKSKEILQLGNPKNKKSELILTFK